MINYVPSAIGYFSSVGIAQVWTFIFLNKKVILALRDKFYPAWLYKWKWHQLLLTNDPNTLDFFLFFKQHYWTGEMCWQSNSRSCKEPRLTAAVQSQRSPLIAWRGQPSASLKGNKNSKTAYRRLLETWTRSGIQCFLSCYTGCNLVTWLQVLLREVGK